jgi:long-chain acyl-CoA synthetase
LYLTVPQFFDRSVERVSEHPAIRNTHDKPGEPREINYGALDDLVAQTAAGLASKGIAKGDRVGIMSRPRIRFAAAALAILRLGAWIVPLDPTFTRTEVDSIVAEAELKAVFVSADEMDRVPDEGILRVNLDDAGEGLAFSALLSDAQAPEVEIAPEDVAVLAYTSGTTGGAKGALLTHANLTADIEACLNVMPITQDDVFLTIAPWHHILGLTTALFVPLYAGALTLYTDEYRSIAALLEQNGVTVFTGVPKLYHAMYEKLIAEVHRTLVGRVMHRLAPRLVGRRIKDRLTGGRLRFFVSGSAPLDPWVSLGFRRLGIGLLEGYGLTETSPVISFCDPFSRKGGCVGRPLPGLEAKLANRRADGVGELLVRGPTVMAGYYKNEAATREVIDEDGWFHTGDLARIDRDGEIFLKGREKNVIVLESGKNVYPEEVEWELGRIRYVEDVLVRGGSRGGREVVEAVVYPDREALEADGRGNDPKTAIWEAIRRRQARLAPHKRIRRKEDIVLVDEPFPKTSTMDIKRHLYKGGNGDLDRQ